MTQGEREDLLEADGKHYQQTYLPTARPFEGVRALFTAIKQAGGTVVLATDCTGAPLRAYRHMLNVDYLIDPVVCGDVQMGKPDPALIRLAIQKLGLPAGRCVMMGDAPYDGQAAAAAGVVAIGLLSGGFGLEALFEPGAVDVLAQIGELKPLLFGGETASK